MSAAVRRPGRGLEGMLTRLAKEFRRFDFGIQRTRDGTSLEAVRRKPHRDEPGLYAVITDDVNEMRDALLEDKNSPPGQQAPPGGG